MIRSFRAEMLKLSRPSVLYAGGGALLAFSLLATILTFATATTTAASTFNNGPGLASSLQQLAQPAGLSRGFTVAAGFLGLAVFVLFLTSMTSEYGQGTIRTLLARQPRRTRLLTGKLLALLACTAAALLAAEILGALAAIPLAHLRGISTSEWFTTAALAHAASGYTNALLTAFFFGTAGVVLGVLLRSTPVALGVGVAWLGPLEHITQLSWTGAPHWFPGLLFDTVSVGGTSLTSYSWALTLSLAFTIIALAVAGTSFVRRDIST